MNNRFKLYYIDIKYIKKLHAIDDNVPSVSPQIGKQNRPFLGIIVLINGSKFCIPLSSNSSQKHFESIRDNITLRKIYDNKGNLLAVLNLNNMIPVQEDHIYEIDIKIHPHDSKTTRNWKKLCAKELNWCQSHQDEIEHLANELYRIYTSNEPFKKRKICLNFPLLEEACKRHKKG